MRKLILAGLLVLATTLPALAQDRGLLSGMGTCVDGEPREYRVTNGLTATDCTTGTGTYDVTCCCANGTWSACNSASSISSGGGTIDRDASATNIDNDNSETTIYTYTIPAGTLSATGEIRLKIISEFYNNTGSSRGYTVKVKLGGSTVVEFAAGNSIGTTATRRLTTLVVTLSATGATNSQIVTLENYLASTASAFGTVTTGTGLSMGTAVNAGLWNSGTLSTDMTANQTLAVTITLSAAHANLEWMTYAATTELLNP